jgi:hypothetical protein
MTNRAVDHRARAEDIRWFVDTGENLTGAARRLGISTDGVEKWCREHNMRTEYTILRSREPHMPADLHESARRNAEARWAS